MLRVHVAEVYLACVEGVDNAITGRSVHKGPFAVRSVAIAEITVRAFRFRQFHVLRFVAMEDDKRRAFQRIRGERGMDSQDLRPFPGQFAGDLETGAAGQQLDAARQRLAVSKRRFHRDMRRILLRHVIDFRPAGGLVLGGTVLLIAVAQRIVALAVVAEDLHHLAPFRIDAAPHAAAHGRDDRHASMVVGQLYESDLLLADDRLRLQPCHILIMVAAFADGLQPDGGGGGFEPLRDGGAVRGTRGDQLVAMPEIA